MAGTRSSRKRQSRLAFTPLPSSSPAAKDYNKQVQHRAAAVSVDSDGSSRKRRKVQDGGGSAPLDGVNDSMPTPAASLEQRQRAASEVDSSSEDDSEPVRSTQRISNTQNGTNSRRRKPKQGRLDFSSSREPGSFDSPVRVESTRPQFATGGMFGTQRRQQATVILSDESEHEQRSSKEKRTRSGKEGSKTKGSKADESKSSQRVTRGSQRPAMVGVDSDSDSEDDNIVVNRQQVHALKESEDDDEDEMPTTSGTQRRQRASKQPSRDPFVSSSPLAIESDNDLEIIEAPTRKRSRASVSDEDLESGDGKSQPPRRIKRPRQISSREQEDLDDDLEFLGPSSDVEDSSRTPRNTQTAQKSARQKALDKLKRQRSRQQPLDTVEEEEQDPDENEQDDSHDDSVEELDEPHTKSMSSRQMFQEDDDDTGFIEEQDADNPLGVPDGVPLQFTRYASMKAKELFKYAVEWMVQRKINPAFQMDDEIYDLTFKKLDDEVKGLAGSKFTSAAWTPGFTIALKSRPDIAFEQIDRNAAEHFLRDHCDACNRSSHPATYQIQFQGKPYYRETLEEVAGNDDDDDDDDYDDDDSDSEEHGQQTGYNAQGQEVAPVDTIYYVGKFCMSNAKTAHALQHWRFHLNEWVVSWLIAHGYNTPDKIVERDRRSTKKRRKEANKIVDRMEKEGVIRTLWTDFRQNMDDARDSKQGRSGGGLDD